jgi:carboxymethylenebutenolidase
MPGAADMVAPFFVNRGYVFFVPHRRGQGRSPGNYIMDQLNAAKSPRERNHLLVSLNEVHFQDQLAALAHLKSFQYVDQDRLVVMGASFGGIQTMLAVEGNYGYRVAVNCSGAAQTWGRSPDLRARLTDAARKATMRIFFFQAENDYDLTPNRVLSDEVRRAGQTAEAKTYPAFGSGPEGGHKFCWAGTNIWGADVIAFMNRS